ncbi:MAG: hypothetical protein ACPGIC_02230 [Opitutales bacterium]
MRLISATLLALATSLFVAACGGGNDKMRITEGSQPIGRAPTGSVYVTTDANIVHVDAMGRIATIRNGNHFADGAFLIVTQSDGKRSGLLKALTRRQTGLRTADILEGDPNINDIVSEASSAESERLAKIYRDPEEE